jgi:hypothetical protein
VSEQSKCGEYAAIRIFWPGQPPMNVCPEHHLASLAVAYAMGFHLHFEQAVLGATCESAPAREPKEAP